MSLWQLSWDIVIQSVRRSQNSNFGNKLTASIRRPLMPAQSTVARPFRRKYFWNRPEVSEKRFQGRYHNTVAVRIKRHDGAVSSFGEYGLSCGLHVSLCTLQLTCSVFTSAVAVATLGRSGWLILSPQGLPPCKKRQASLGALTILALSRERRESHFE